MRSQKQNQVSVDHPMLTRSKRRRIMLEISGRVPEDLVLAEILPRISCVKTLFRFKCVSRTWYSLISSKAFAKDQLQYSAKNTPLPDYNVILVSATNQGFKFLHGLVGYVFSRSSMNADRFMVSEPMTGYAPKIVGCCNGLCCVFTVGQFIIWNPATGQSRLLPPVLNGFGQVTINGFGYDESTDDYKVVAILNMVFSQDQYVFRVYSLKTNSWKSINAFLGQDAFEGMQISGYKGALVNGKLHWMHGDYMKIVSFDLRTEAAGVVEPPSSQNRPYQKMGVINGCLSVVFDDPNDGIVVWAMKEYGVKKSWFRVLTVPYLGTSLNVQTNYALCVSEDGVVIIDSVHRSDLYFYNPRTDLVKRLKLKAYHPFQADLCIQSLVSPLS